MNNNCECNNCNGTCYVSGKAEETLLHDLVKTVQMGVTSIDVVEEKITSDQLKQWLVSQKDAYRHYSDQVDDYMRGHGYDEEFVTKMQTMFQRGMVKMSALGLNNDSDIAQQLVKGTNMGIDTLTKTINNPKGISDELLQLADKILSFLNDSLNRLREWL